MPGQFRLTGSVRQAFKDGPDVDHEQDLRPVSGWTAKFTNNYPGTAALPDGDDVTYLSGTRSVTLLPTGEITEDGVNPGISLTAHDPDLFDSPLQWTISPGWVTVNGKRFKPSPWTFDAPTDGDDKTLGECTAVASQEMTSIARGPAGAPVDDVQSTGDHVQFYVQGNPIGDAVQIPGATWAGTTGKPAVIAAGADQTAARAAISVMSSTEVTNAITAAVNGILNGAPGALDTLKELADALGDDPNFAATVTTALSGKQATITAGTSAQYYRGDKTMQTLNQDAVPDGTTNKAYTSSEKTKLAGVAVGATATASAPSYATAPKNAYDAPRNAYNWKASNTRNLRASLDRAARGTGKANHVFIGDSTTAGYLGATSVPAYDSAQAWPRQYRTALAALGLPVAGTGLVPASNNGSTNYDSRWSFTGAWSNQAYLMYISASGATATFVSDTPGTSVTVFYNGASAGMTVAIDGGSATALTMNSQYNQSQTFTGLANTTHTVVITTTSASYNGLFGVAVTGGNGLVCHNIAVGGSRAYGNGSFLAAWADATQGYVNSTLCGALSQASISPDVVYIALGVNDLQAPTAIATIITAITSLRTQYASADVVLLVEYQVSGYTWSTWAAALYALADTLDVPLIDLYDRSGGYTVANSNGLMGGDIAHPNAVGQKDWGQLAASLAANWCDATSRGPVVGDASTNATASVDSEIALFSSTSGKLLKRATGSGMAKLTSGVLGVGTVGTDYGSPDTAAATLTNKTLTSPVLTSPQVNSFFDTNGNSIIGLAATASAVNGLTLANGATGAGPSLSASGADTNIDLYTVPKGTGRLMVYKSTGDVVIGADGGATNVNTNLTTKGTGVVQANGVPVATTTGAQTLTNKTLTTPVLTGLPTGTGVAAAATASTLAARDSNGNLFANNVAQAFATTATAGATTTLTVASAAVQSFTGTSNQTVALPTTGIVAGQEFLILSGTTGVVTVNASGGATVQAVAAGKYVRVTALVATPTLATHWYAEYPPSTTGVTSGAAAAAVATSEATTSTTYADLTTTTDTVTITVSSSGIAQVTISAQVTVSGAGTSIAQMAYAVSGASTVAASDALSALYQGFAAGAGGQCAASFVVTGLTPGSTTFKAKYKAVNGGSGSGTATFSNRRISAVPL